MTSCLTVRSMVRWTAALIFPLACLAQSNDLPSFVPGRLLVKFKNDVSAERSRGRLAEQGARSASVIEPLGVHVVELPGNANEQAVLNIFKNMDEVEFAELDHVLKPQAVTPNDSYYNQQWILWTMRMSTAWSTTTGSTSLVLALVDTGVDPNQFDLYTKLVTGVNLFDGGSIWDWTGHGTQVAGVNAATNNSFGVAGVCWGCRLMPIRVSDQNGNATVSKIAEGINWAINNNAKIINVGYAASDNATVQSAAQNAWSRGALVFAPAGNDDTSRNGTFNSSSNNPYIITVGAVQEQLDTHYSWSNTGNNIDLVAGGCVVTTTLSSMFAVSCGTSFASAAAAGVAALVLSANPSLSPTAVENILKQSAVDLGSAGWDSTFGSGRVDGAAAVAMAVGSKSNTTTALVSSLNPSILGQLVTFTATVSPSSATGTVTFKDGATVLGTSQVLLGVATHLTSALSTGNHAITAVYSGDGNHNSSTSSNLTQTVNSTPKTNTTTALASSLNPSTSGQTVTFTATLSHSAATGTVTFKDGATTLATANVSNGRATYSTSSLSAGTHSITATYNGDSNYNPSTSATLLQTVNTASKTNTTTGLASSVNPSTSGQTVTFTATVSHSAVTGTVTFKDGATILATASVSGGVATYSTSSLSAGSHSMSATYNGDANYNGSTSAVLTQTVNTTSKVNTTTTLTSNLNPSVYGQLVTFTATVSSSSATGTMSFFKGGVSMGSSPVNGGVATLSTSTLAVGTHSIQASYGGDSGRNSSISNIITQTVNSSSGSKTNTTTWLTSNRNPSTAGQTVTFSATVSPAATGTVTFYDGGTAIGSAALSGGVANYSTSSLTAGTHNITATYGGNTSYNGSSSNTVSQSVTAVSFIDTTPPTVSITSPKKNARISGTAYNIAGTAGDNSGSWTVTVTIAPRATPASQTFVCSRTTSNWSCLWNSTLVPDGAYVFKATAVDPPGNTTYTTVVATVRNR